MMKKIIYIVSIGLISYNFSSCSKANKITEAEKTDLRYLREEEKLARDVYLYSYDVYGEQIFNNIASSEQKHMDKMLGLLDDYKIEDPASSVRGVFNNEELQELYDHLISISDTSLLGALIVGATIEDVDIFDIEEFMTRTSQKDIQNVYEKLECGSTNHMRSFNKELETMNYTYTPQYISQSEYNSITNAENTGCGK